MGAPVDDIRAWPSEPHNDLHSCNGQPSVMANKKVGEEAGTLLIGLQNYTLAKSAAHFRH